MNNPKTNHRSLVSLQLPRPSLALVAYAAGIVTAMTGNPSFPTPAPTLAEVTTAVDALRTAEQAVLGRVKGAVLHRDETRTALVQLLEELKAYIQKMADANVENGASIIASAGVAVRRTPVHKPRVFEARSGKVSGSALVLAPAAGRRASYEWQYSLDGGKTWIAAPVTLQAKTTVLGLTPGATVVFRSRAVTKGGEGDWTQPVALIVK